MDGWLNLLHISKFHAIDRSAHRPVRIILFIIISDSFMIFELVANSTGGSRISQFLVEMSHCVDAIIRV